MRVLLMIALQRGRRRTYEVVPVVVRVVVRVVVKAVGRSRRPSRRRVARRPRRSPLVATFRPRHDLAPGKRTCELRMVPVRGVGAAASCNIACYATSECRGFVLAADPKGRHRCYLKRCDTPIVPLASGSTRASNVSVIEAATRKVCAQGEPMYSLNTITGMLRPLGGKGTGGSGAPEPVSVLGVAAGAGAPVPSRAGLTKISTCVTTPGPAKVLAGLNLAPGVDGCDVRMVPVRGPKADDTCNIACYATPACKAYTLYTDPKGRIKCYLKRCDTPLVPSPSARTGVPTGARKACAPDEQMMVLNTMSGDVSPA